MKQRRAKEINNLFSALIFDALAVANKKQPFYKRRYFSFKKATNEYVSANRINLINKEWFKAIGFLNGEHISSLLYNAGKNNKQLFLEGQPFTICDNLTIEDILFLSGGEDKFKEKIKAFVEKNLSKYKKGEHMKLRYFLVPDPQEDPINFEKLMELCEQHKCYLPLKQTLILNVKEVIFPYKEKAEQAAELKAQIEKELEPIKKKVKVKVEEFTQEQIEMEHYPIVNPEISPTLTKFPFFPIDWLPYLKELNDEEALCFFM